MLILDIHKFALFKHGTNFFREILSQVVHSLRSMKVVRSYTLIIFTIIIYKIV